MAYYDVLTDTIKDCTPYTYEWFHERRHQKQFRVMPWLRKVDSWLHTYTYALASSFLLAGLLSFINWRLTFILMGVATTPYALMNLLIELDAMIFGTFAWLQYNKVRKTS